MIALFRAPDFGIKYGREHFKARCLSVRIHDLAPKPQAEGRDLQLKIVRGIAVGREKYLHGISLPEILVVL